MQRHCKRTTTLALGKLVTLAVIAGAQNMTWAAESDGNPPKSPTASAEAKALRDKAFDHLKKKEYAQAVEFYQKSLVWERKVGAMSNMASALDQLGRYDEALHWYERALEEFPNASAATRKKATDEHDALLAKVGTIAVDGDVVEGLRLFIDDRDVGALPLQTPVRVLAGVHEVRAAKTGFAPIVTSVDVTAGRASVAKLVAKPRQAKLDIREKHNWVLHVEMDGQDIGVTPLSKIVAPGVHRIRLLGYMQPDALLLCETPEQSVDMGARMESEEQVIKVGLFETQSVELSAEDMDASLHIETTPPMAGLWIDGHDVGKTPWEGRLALGEHAIEVRSKGFYVAKQKVTLERRKSRDWAIILERERPSKASSPVPRNIALGVGALGLGTFVVSGAMAINTHEQLVATCPNQICFNTSGVGSDGGKTAAIVSTISFWVGSAGAIAGTALWLITPTDEKNDRANSGALGLTLGPGQWGVVGRF